jgi:hypothetical protein
VVVVPGGTAAGSFRREDAANMIRDYVQKSLGLNANGEG